MEKVLGFSIEIKGQESELSKMSDLKREILEVEKNINKLKEATKGNIGAQKASATQMAELQTNAKLLKKEYGEQERKIIDNTRATRNASGSYNELVAANKKLSAELRALPIDSTNARFKQLQSELTANTNKLKEFDSAIGRSHRNVGNYGESLRGIASAAGLAFGVGEVVNFTKEAITMASKLEGIEGAFKRLNKPGLLDELRAATKGTVNDMDLMKAAVNANNFQIPLETMGSLLKFAQQRAQETGQSVDYLTESIVTGIARKSPLILDNLGINVQRINKEFKKTGDFALAAGKIVEEELQKQGNLALTTADKVSKMGAAWDNAKTKIGGVLIELGFRITTFFENIADGGIDKALGANIFEAKAKAMLVHANNYLAEQTKGITDAGQRDKKSIEIINKEIIAIGKISKNAKTQQDLDAHLSAIRQLEKQRDALKKVTTQTVKEVSDEEIKAMEEARKKREDEIKKNNELILKLTNELAKGQVDLMKAGLDKDLAAVEVKYNIEIKALEASLVKKKKLSAQEIEINRLTNERITQLQQQKANDVAKIKEDNLKTVNDFAYKELEIQEQIAIESAKQQYDNEEEKQQTILDIQKDYAQQKIDLLEAGGDAETLEVKLQIAKLKTVIDSELKSKKAEKGKSPFEMMFGSDKDTAKQAIDSAIQLAKQISDAVLEVQRERNQRILDNDLERIQAQSETELTLLENRLRNGQITDIQFAEEKKAIDAKRRQDELQAKREAFEKEKKLKKSQIAIELALELIRIAAAYANIPYVGWATAAVQGAAAVAAAGVQYAIVDNQRFEKGGIAKGKSHKEGGIPFTVAGQGGYEMEGGEAIINKRSTSMFGGLLSMINQAGGGKKFEMGGIASVLPNSSSNAPQLGLNMDLFAEKIIRGFNDKQVYQTESSVRGVLNRVNQLERESSF